MNSPNLVAWRKSHGSLCHVCPLNGQRKVGCSGNIDASHIATTDFPSDEDSKLGVSRGERYGRILEDKLGYWYKREHIVQGGMAKLVRVPGRRWPRVVLSDIFITSLIMCHIPGKGKAQQKIKSPIWKAARLCCENSWRRLMRKLLTENSERTLEPMGVDALCATYGEKMSIEGHRGRVAEPMTKADIDRVLAPVPELDIYKKVLRGKHPQEEWWDAIEWFLKGAIKGNRASLRAQIKAAKLAAVPPEVMAWTKEWKKQKAASARRAKKEAASEASLSASAGVGL